MKKVTHFKKTNDKKESIQKNLIKCTIIILSVLSAILIITSVCFIYHSSMSILDNSINTTLESTSSLIERILYTLKNDAQNVASMETICNKNSTKEERLEVMEQIRSQNNYDEVGFVEMDGKGYSNYGDFDFNDQFHFQAAKKGELFIGEPIVNRLNGQVILISGAPVYSKDEIIGTVYIVDFVEAVNDKIESISFGKTGYAYVLNEEGTIIYHKDKQMIANETNPIELAKTDKSYKSLANAVKKIISSENNGKTYYKFNGKNMYATFCPVEGYPQWRLVMVAPKIEFTYSIYISFFINIIISFIILVISIFVMIKLIKKITIPIRKITNSLLLLSNGNLSQEIPILETQDEIGILSSSLKNTVSNLNNYISDITHVLHEISKGNLDVSTSADFRGDFLTIKKSLDEIITSLNSTLSRINETAKTVDLNAGYVSSRAQNLAESTSDQASVVEELSAGIIEITDKVAITAKSTEKASLFSSETSSDMNSCNNQMNEMVNAMLEIKEASNQIHNIISNIEDIASQTNLLSLNASIEAARAGEAGKGFAVVAQEIGSLANESANSAKNTANLIQQSILAVENGTNIANMTASSLSKAVERVNEISSIISDISIAANEQKVSIEQISLGVEQMSSAIQTNSANAEESASTSEELSSEANILKQLVEQFKLKS